MNKVSKEKISDYYRWLMLFVLGLFVGNMVTHYLNSGDWLGGTIGDLITGGIILLNFVEWYFVERPLKKQSKQA